MSVKRLGIASLPKKNRDKLVGSCKIPIVVALDRTTYVNPGHQLSFALGPIDAIK